MKKELGPLEEDLRDRLRRGDTLAQVARLRQCNIGAVATMRNRIIDKGHWVPPRTRQAPTRDYIAKQLEAGRKPLEIAAELGVASTFIYRMRKEIRELEVESRRRA